MTRVLLFTLKFFIILNRLLDTLLSFIDYGLGKDIFIRLLEYYKTVDAEGALYYWNEYKQNEE